MSPRSWRRHPRYPLAASIGLAIAATVVSPATMLAVAASRGGLGDSQATDGRRTTIRSISADPPAASTATATSTATVGPTTTVITIPRSPSDGRPTDPEQVAAAFTAAFLTFRWDDPADGLRRRCRPWDTDGVDAALAGPWVPPDRDRRAANHETDDAATHTVSPQDRAADHLDASVAAVVTRERPGQRPQTVVEFLDLRVIATPGGWAVDEVSE